MHESRSPSEKKNSLVTHESQPATVEWRDTQGRDWRITPRDASLVLQHGPRQLVLEAADWPRDLYITREGRRVVIRVETFADSVVFERDADEAAAILAHVSGQARGGLETGPATAPHREADHVEEAAAPLLWPKVSRLAVWALILSAIVFVPAIGVLAVTGVAVLLRMHRGRVRRSWAWSHSRALCKVAAVFSLVGLAVNGVSTAGLLRTLQVAGSGETAAVNPARPSPPVRNASHVPTRQVCSSAVLAQGSSLAEKERNWPLIIAGLLVVLLSLTVHEAAHAITAWWLGDDFARRLGRVTLNPLAHIDPLGTVVLPLLLYLSGAGVFGWARPVPVRTEVLDRPRRGHILIAIAGPGSNLLLAAVSLMFLLGIACAIRLWVPEATIHRLVSLDLTAMVATEGVPLAGVVGGLLTVLKLSFVINVFLAFFNLIPIPPLDGSWVLEHLFPRTLGAIYARIRPMGFVIFVAVLWMGLLKYLILPAVLALRPGFWLLDACTGF